MEQQLVIFDLVNEHYGVDIGTVQSIIKMQEITVIPRSPSFVEGVTSLRGTVLPVIDLHKRFGLPAQDETKDTRIVVVEMNGATAGTLWIRRSRRMSSRGCAPLSPISTTVPRRFPSRT